MHFSIFSFLTAVLFTQAALGQDLKTVVAVQQAKITQLSTQSHPVGSIIQTILGPDSVASEFGKGWVELKGQDISGTRLCDLLKREGRVCMLPDARGRFLRTVGPGAEGLGVSQNDATRVTAVTSTITVTAQPTVDIAHDHGTHSHTSPIYRSTAEFSNGTTDLISMGGRGVATNYGTSVAGSSANVKLDSTTKSVTGGAYSLKLTGDSETRPVNLTVNTYIKVN